MKRNKFSLSHYVNFSAHMGYLIPCACVEVLPGDTLQQATSMLLRCSPLVTPVMHPCHVIVQHWYVPYRLIWDNFTNFITGGEDGMDASVFPTRTFGGGGAAVGSLADYLGVTPSVNNLVVSALPFRAYSLIWNEAYRDQDLQDPLVVSTADGNDTTTNVTLQRRAWEKDYFTSARPWEAKGPSITIPIGDTAPVLGIGIDSTDDAPGGGSGTIKQSDLTSSAYTSWWGLTDPIKIDKQTNVGGTYFPNIRADLSEASAITVNALREALGLQRYQEARARYGSRYVEYLRYLGLRSSDARLQRPEYLGGGRQTIQFSEVIQTGLESGQASAGVGNLKGHGIAAMRSNRYRRYFEEHGVVLTLMSVRPKTMYVNGLQRFWNRRTKEDFWQLELQHIGQQEVLNKEVYAAHTTPDGVFGYQDRYDEYRRCESRVAGEFRTTLNSWHLGRVFASDPALNDTFVQCVPAESRVFATAAADTLWIMANHSIQARRLVAATGHSYIY